MVDMSTKVIYDVMVDLVNQKIRAEQLLTKERSNV